MTRFVLGISGSVAAVKVVSLVHDLVSQGHECKVILTRGGLDFVTKTALASMGASVFTDDSADNRTYTSIMEHINLAKWADYILVVPASANTIAKVANGLADNLLTATILASSAPVIFIPAMNQQMWQAQATQINIDKLLGLGHDIWGPAHGLQACGDIGAGRMLEVEQIVIKIKHLLLSAKQTYNLHGLKLVISAGHTSEAIDPVRYITNRSSGKMGYCLAEAAMMLGAEVSLISGGVTLPVPHGLKNFVAVETADDVMQHSLALAQDANVFISSIAVCDYKPKQVSANKIKKSPADNLLLELTCNKDILTEIAAQYPDLFLVGFAAETENVVENAINKLKRKHLSMIIANDVSNGKVFGQDNSQITLIDNNFQCYPSAQMPKEQLAYFIFAHLETQPAALKPSI